MELLKLGIDTRGSLPAYTSILFLLRGTVGRGPKIQRNRVVVCSEDVAGEMLVHVSLYALNNFNSTPAHH